MDVFSTIQSDAGFSRFRRFRAPFVHFTAAVGTRAAAPGCFVDQIRRAKQFGFDAASRAN